MERWKINLYTIWFSQIFMMMGFGFGMPFLPFYIQDLGVTDPDQVKIYSTLLTTAPAVTMAIMAPIWGIAADKWGKKLMLLRAMLFAAFIIGGMGLVANANQLLVLRLLQGVFTGTITAATALVATGTPSNRLSYALGFLSSSTFIGNSAGPVIGGFLADYFGYRASFQIGGLLALIDFIVVLLLVKEEAPQAMPVQKERSKQDLRSTLAMFSSLMLILFFLIFILRFVRSAFNPFLPLFVQEKLADGFSPTKATGIINGVTGLVTAIAGLTVCRLGDRYSKVMIIRTTLALGLAVTIPLLLAGNLVLFTLFYGLFFFFLGSTEPIVISMTSEMTPPEKRGTLFGIQALVSNTAWIISPTVAGIVSVKMSIQSVLFLLPIFLVPGLAAIILFGKKKPEADGTISTASSCPADANLNQEL